MGFIPFFRRQCCCCIKYVSRDHIMHRLLIQNMYYIRALENKCSLQKQNKSCMLDFVPSTPSKRPSKTFLFILMNDMAASHTFIGGEEVTKWELFHCFSLLNDGTCSTTTGCLRNLFHLYSKVR